MNLLRVKVFPFIILIILFQMTNGFSQEPLAVPDPVSFFGFEPGADQMLFTYEELIAYLKKVDEVSPRVEMREIGKSPLGKTMYIAFISSKENIENLDRLQVINKKLALDPKIADLERDQLVKEGKVFVYATLSMHSGEVAPAQAAPLVAYDLATTSDINKLQWLNDVVYMMVPNHNPDGMDMIVNHYNKYKGTKYEGSSMPGVYHKYVGHDNNRDFVILSQEDTRAIAAVYNKTWFPQVMVEKHQMGSLGPRYYVPPSHDPIAENIESELWTWTTLYGSRMIQSMTAQGLKGISQHYLFDDYWPGSTETCIWKNVIGMLTEAASVDYAKPIYIEPNELQVHGKGLSEYKKSINMPEVWPGGWWHLSDIVDLELGSTFAIIETSSLYREEILRFRNDICRREVERGKTEAPYYYILPLQQHDAGELTDLIDLMHEHGVETYQLSSDISMDGRLYQKGDVVIPLAQPFRPFVKEVFEAQEYPLRHYTPGGEIIKPYDITSWSLPLHRGLRSEEIEIRSDLLENSLTPLTGSLQLAADKPATYTGIVLSANQNQSYRAAFSALKKGLKVSRLAEDAVLEDNHLPAGSFIVMPGSEKIGSLINELNPAPLFLTENVKAKTIPLKMPRIALIETYFHDMDAGWTRFVLDQYDIPFKVVHPGDFAETDFAEKFDVVVFPDADKSVLMDGKYKSKDDYYISSYPPEYTKGIGKEGMGKLMTYLHKGGLIVAWGRSTSLFEGTLEITLGKDKKEEFQLPFRDISDNLEKEGLYFPGSLVRLNLSGNHPLTLGLPSEIGVFYRGRPVFQTSLPDFDMDRRVLGVFPEKDVLLSGYGENEEKVGNKSAFLWVKKGKGQLVLMAFNPQFRASTQGSYKLLFNSLLLRNMQ